MESLSFLMMLFQSELGSSVLVAGPIRCLWTSGSSTKKRKKRDRRGSPVASPMPKSVLSCGKEDQILRE